eukprot:scaffold375147_cov43-Prasinocladus_malaysianus.AAC.1
MASEADILRVRVGVTGTGDAPGVPARPAGNGTDRKEWWPWCCPGVLPALLGDESLRIASASRLRPQRGWCCC